MNCNRVLKNIIVLAARISLWRWIVAFLILFFFTLSHINIYMNYIYVHSTTGYLSEYFIGLFNDEYFICYILFIIIILLSIDVFNPTSNNYEENLYIRFGNRFLWHRVHVLYVSFISFLIVIALLAISFILGVAYGLSFKISSSLVISLMENLNIKNSTFTILISLGLIYLRLVFLCLIVYAINLKSKFPFGVFVVFIITVFDMFFYQMTNISMPLFILPLEHTRTLFTSGAFPAPEGKNIRISYIYSLIYWMLLIISLLLFLKRIIIKKEFIMTENKY